MAFHIIRMKLIITRVKIFVKLNPRCA